MSSAEPGPDGGRSVEGASGLRHLRARLASGANALNRNPRFLAAVKRTRENVLGDDEFVDRLSTIRGRPGDLVARELVALRADSPGVLGELGLTVLQAWQNLAERQGRGRGAVETAVLFTDLVGFSSWALAAGDEAAIELLRDVSDAIEPPILAGRGEVVKRLGDGLMAVFWDAGSAVEAAFAASERVSAVEADGYRPCLRTGIHLGRPRRIGGDYFGVDVNIAARVAEAAEPGEILVTERAFAALNMAAVADRRRSVTAKGAPANLTVHSLGPALPGERETQPREGGVRPAGKDDRESARSPGPSLSRE